MLAIHNDLIVFTYFCLALGVLEVTYMFLAASRHIHPNTLESRMNAGMKGTQEHWEGCLRWDAAMTLRWWYNPTDPVSKYSTFPSRTSVSERRWHRGCSGVIARWTEVKGSNLCKHQHRPFRLFHEYCHVHSSQPRSFFLPWSWLCCIGSHAGLFPVSFLKEAELVTLRWFPYWQQQLLTSTSRCIPQLTMT